MAQDIRSNQEWSAEKSEKLYGFNRWGDRYFSVNKDGFACVEPMLDGRKIKIADVVAEAKSIGLKPPLTIRFQDILRHRVIQLNDAFQSALKEEEYDGEYKGVFPIKVNHLREVVEEIMDAGECYNFGLEAGSKAELLIALALHENNNSMIICNGYKDEEYIRLAFLGKKLGKEIYLVIEQQSELSTILKISKEFDTKPLLGIRIKLTTEGEGKWAESSGIGAKFGLTSTEIIEVTRQLKRSGFKDSLKLIHIHIGSQVPNIQTIKKAVVEASRYYCEIARLGFPMQYLDVGGGLGIDYDGSRTNFESSINYSLLEYARNIVFNIKTVCTSSNIACPTIISESGRAIVALHSVLIVEVVDRIKKPEKPIEKRITKKRHHLLSELDYILQDNKSSDRLEYYHDAQRLHEEAVSLFSMGYLNLNTLAEAESLYWKICKKIYESVPISGYKPEELENLQYVLSENYICNFSVFQSLIDHWACNQLFPVAPIHRLGAAPTVNATLVDITCDSEGKIDAFIDLENEENKTIPLHPLEKENPYYLGIFLVGAYQDIMGDIHNLFGRVGEAHVFLDDNEADGFYIEETVNGSKVSDLLKLIQYRSNDLARLMKKQIDRSTKDKQIKAREGVRLLDFYENQLEKESYLTPKNSSMKRKRIKKD